MNPYAYRTTGLAIKTLYNLSKAKVNLHGTENIPKSPTIFVINHFTRIETILLPYYIFHQIRVPVWSLADYRLFKGALGDFLDMMGAVSTKDPHRDRLIVKSLLTGEAAWIIFPEGRMVKTKKILENGKYMISHPGGKAPPHTGAATLGLRTEFYRKRIFRMHRDSCGEADRLLSLFGIENIENVQEKHTRIVPVNVTYYPIRARENILSSMASRFLDGLPERLLEEIMTEGSMLLSGVDVDIRFGKPIKLENYISHAWIEEDISSKREIGFDDMIPSRKIMSRLALDIMHRYMSDIYHMTTVNHDHLFATMLRHFPFRRISETDLRRRVFYCITHTLKKSTQYLHLSLNEDQLPLLVDDHYHKFSDFLSIALEKGTIRREGNKLVKNPKSFKGPSDFHKFRIENPVGVIANEVEPLKKFQRHVALHAWLPNFYIRFAIAGHFHKIAVKEFLRDYKTYFSKEESKKKSIGMPYLIRGGFRKTGVLLIHGYMAAPLEVRELAEYLNRKGYWVYAPRLRGHGTTSNDLSTRTYSEWIKSVERGYAVISNLCHRVVVGGFSTGAGLALDLASRISEISGVFAISSPMRLKYLSYKFAPAVDVWNRLLKTFHMESEDHQFVEVEPENEHISYRKNPVSGIREVERLMSNLEPRLTNLQTPALVMASLNDPIVDHKGSMHLFELLGAREKAYVLLERDRHVIIRGPGASIVHRTIANFIEDTK